MQSKMTEEQFRVKLLEKLVNRSPTESAAHLAAEVAREAGLEFAPEPMKLPGKTAFRLPESGNAPVPRLLGEVDGRWRYLDVAEGTALCRRADAYPGLRETAERFGRDVQLHLSVPITANRLHALEAQLGEFLAELAKGPK
jgi:hypothetical protein